MAFIIDTNVLSEIRKDDAADPNVQAWLDSVPVTTLYVSVIALGEIRQGVERLRPRDPEQARVFEKWLDKLDNDFADRIVDVTRAISDEWGRLSVPDPIQTADGLMAATAKVHDWTVVTRNVSDFERTGVAILNPFEPPAAN